MIRLVYFSWTFQFVDIIVVIDVGLDGGFILYKIVIVANAMVQDRVEAINRLFLIINWLNLILRVYLILISITLKPVKYSFPLCY